MRYQSVAIALVAAAAALQLGACGVGEASINAASPATPLPVGISRPSRSDIFATYQTTATLSPDAEATVPARVAGEVVDILVEEGDRVIAGQVLARLDGDRLRLRMLQAKANLDKVRKEYERLSSLLEKGLVSASAIDGLRFDMDSLEAAYRLQRLDYEYTNIRATIDGVVSAREIKVGQNLDVNDATFRITDTGRLVAYIRIPQTELHKFSVGHLATVRVDSAPGEVFTASIARISPTIDARNGTFRVTAYIGNQDGLLAPGMFGRIEIAYEQHTDALVIPAAALVNEDNQTVVYVVEDGEAKRQVVRTGIRSANNIEVLEGLHGDEQIVVTGQGSLRDGSRVLASIESNVPITG